MIDIQDQNMITYVNNAKEACNTILLWHENNNTPSY